VEGEPEEENNPKQKSLPDPPSPSGEGARG
jgi:hypothetical protein